MINHFTSIISIRQRKFHLRPNFNNRKGPYLESVMVRSNLNPASVHNYDEGAPPIGTGHNFCPLSQRAVHILAHKPRYYQWTLVGSLQPLYWGS